MGYLLPVERLHHLPQIRRGFGVHVEAHLRVADDLDPSGTTEDRPFRVAAMQCHLGAFDRPGETRQLRPPMVERVKVAVAGNELGARQRRLDTQPIGKLVSQIIEPAHQYPLPSPCAKSPLFRKNRTTLVARLRCPDRDTQRGPRLPARERLPDLRSPTSPHRSKLLEFGRYRTIPAAQSLII